MEKDVQNFMESLGLLDNEVFKPFAPAIAEAFRAGYEVGMMKGLMQQDVHDKVMKVYMEVEDGK